MVLHFLNYPTSDISNYFPQYLCLESVEKYRPVSSVRRHLHFCHPKLHPTQCCSNHKYTQIQIDIISPPNLRPPTSIIAWNLHSTENMIWWETRLLVFWKWIMFSLWNSFLGKILLYIGAGLKCLVDSFFMLPDSCTLLEAQLLEVLLSSAPRECRNPKIMDALIVVHVEQMDQFENRMDRHQIDYTKRYIRIQVCEHPNWVMSQGCIAL